MHTLIEVHSHNLKEMKAITEWASVSCIYNFIPGVVDFTVLVSPYPKQSSAVIMAEST